MENLIERIFNLFERAQHIISNAFFTMSAMLFFITNLVITFLPIILMYFLENYYMLFGLILTIPYGILFLLWLADYND